MTDIEQKALGLVNEVCLEKGVIPYAKLPNIEASEALCRAINQNEAFRQEVSDAVVDCHACSDPEVWWRIKFELDRFIIPKPKPDPLVEVMKELSWDEETAAEEWAGDIRAALEARGFEIREKHDD